MRRNILRATVILGMLCNLPPATAEEALISFKIMARNRVSVRSARNT